MAQLPGREPQSCMSLSSQPTSWHERVCITEGGWHWCLHRDLPMLPFPSCVCLGGHSRFSTFQRSGMWAWPTAGPLQWGLCGSCRWSVQDRVWTGTGWNICRCRDQPVWVVTWLHLKALDAVFFYTDCPPLLSSQGNLIHFFFFGPSWPFIVPACLLEYIYLFAKWYLCITSMYQMDVPWIVGLDMNETTFKVENEMILWTSIYEVLNP